MPQLGNIAFAAFVEQVGEDGASKALADPAAHVSIDAARQRHAMGVLDQVLMMEQA